MMPRFTDSLDKIILTYFAGVTKESFTYKLTKIEPLPVFVKPALFKTLKCHANCAACCPMFTLDYLPDEPRPDTAVKRIIKFKGKEIPIYTDKQKDNNGYHCHFVNQEGRCDIHEMNPFSCDFETIRFLRFRTGRGHWQITNKLFGRAWNMKRIDGDRGALCELSDITPDARPTILRKFRRLKSWTDHFELDTRLDDIIEWAQSTNMIAPFNSELKGR
jgi:hypothetical protein